MKNPFRINPINIKREIKKDEYETVVHKVELNFWHSTFDGES
jgi:hypothetical protein